MSFAEPPQFDFAENFGKDGLALVAVAHKMGYIAR
jgi:hypothetical protein